MANFETGLLKLAATKASWVVFPLGLIGVATIWASRARGRRSAPSGNSPREATGAASPGKRTSYNPTSGSSFRGGNNREALLSQILEDNIRLREALK